MVFAAAEDRAFATAMRAFAPAQVAFATALRAFVAEDRAFVTAQSGSALSQGTRAIPNNSYAAVHDLMLAHRCRPPLFSPIRFLGASGTRTAAARPVCPSAASSCNAFRAFNSSRCAVYG